ncbi:hypothetical protein AQJ46_02155 [Streptomyces canus]|uniref:Uncharacterized protein n=1 Tax=Streptomyces canus TaxID=58343 RepID=A0A101SHI5_9ACTN|nr:MULTISPECIES: hypothetical protein [Streptomyces]KUN74379.1 hypothetical protein AQJ46_02155 [Streptomyces canus]MDI5903699.1 hypothetical protein [Streptomyces sp. 12257]
MQQELTALDKRSCASQNKALPLKTQTLPIGDVDQKVQLRAGQKTLKGLGAWNVTQPLAVKAVENRWGPFLHLPARRLPTLLKRVLFEDDGAYAAAELEAAQPSGTAD